MSDQGYYDALFFNLLLGRSDNGLRSVRNSRIVDQRVIEFDNDQIGLDITKRADNSWLVFHPKAEQVIDFDTRQKILALDEQGLKRSLRAFERREGVQLKKEVTRNLKKNLRAVQKVLEDDACLTAKALCQRLNNAAKIEV